MKKKKKKDFVGDCRYEMTFANPVRTITEHTLKRWLRKAKKHMEHHSGTYPHDEILARDIIRVLGEVLK